ncbi:hypothetical protein B9Q02_12110 [Candidatus Marsarchaeota G1 archaeon BE_D]|uniref:Methyltransferase FkbM domain-containing protein n=1 Tax=Candidatus Marsarchaeota G1 archaeon BE_D TaxID=1978156 RepID=A0A2R6A703_9ARCH|nr:MAG: hypothetical protein B9Q02_12110 [Candidatus Marsarchaeota G1 archaeon BE_D]
MDCEGCEYHIFNHTDQSTLDKIEKVILEFHGGPQGIPNRIIEKPFHSKVHWFRYWDAICRKETTYDLKPVEESNI